MTLINDSLEIAGAFPVIKWSGIRLNGVWRPYYSTVEALATIPSGVRSEILPVYIKPNGSIDPVREFYFSNSTTLAPKVDKYLDERLTHVEENQGAYQTPPVYTAYTAFAETGDGANPSYTKDAGGIARTWYSQLFLTSPPLDFTQFTLWAPLEKGEGTGNGQSGDPGYFDF